MNAHFLERKGDKDDKKARMASNQCWARVLIIVKHGSHQLHKNSCLRGVVRGRKQEPSTYR